MKIDNNQTSDSACGWIWIKLIYLQRIHFSKFKSFLGGFNKTVHLTKAKQHHLKRNRQEPSVELQGTN